MPLVGPDELSWIKDGLHELSQSGPLWVLAGMVGVAIVFRWDKIVNAHTERWKTKAETKQKLQHKQARFDEGTRARRQKQIKPPGRR